jgi:hypothetical protein
VPQFKAMVEVGCPFSQTYQWNGSRRGNELHEVGYFDDLDAAVSAKV